MFSINALFAFFCFFIICSVTYAAPPSGLVAQWDFDEGQGEVTHDASGQGRDGEIYGATWVQQAQGFALKFDGAGQYIDGGDVAALGITGPVTVEAWIKPAVAGHGEAGFVGPGMSSFVLTYYNGDLCYWYIGAGSNNLRGKLTLDQWNHVVGTFDGQTISMWINGRLMGTRESKIKHYTPAGRMIIGSTRKSDGPRFQGMVDRVRVYSRALSPEEAIAHFKNEAGEYGFDRTWFSRVKVKPYYYLNRGEVVLNVNYQGLQPLQSNARLEAVLFNRKTPDKPVHRELIDPLPESGLVEIKLPCRELSDGDYLIRVKLADEQNSYPVEELTFSYPPNIPALPSPADQSPAPLTAAPATNPFAFAMDPTGGFSVTLNDTTYPFRSRISWPHGQFNSLGAGEQGEPTWQVRVRSVDANQYEVSASGKFYTLNRQLDAFPTHVYIKDTYTNTTDQDLGILIYNEMTVEPGQIKRSLLGGFEGRTRIASAGSAPIFSPSVFVSDTHAGIGIVPVDDVYVVQSVLYNEQTSAGVGTEKFTLAPGQSYTLEWAVYPTGSRDYYDFINTFRKVENRIGTVDGGFGFMSFGPMNRRQVPDEDFFENRGMKYGIVHTLSATADDPQLSVEGIEFMDFPKEMQLIRAQASAFHEKHPDRKIMFHVAHSLYLTNNPDRFSDSKVILDSGKQAVWDANEPYVSKQRHDEGWTWWIYYPTHGNSFHDLLMRSADVMMDDLGMDGVFMDGFFCGYQGLWTYDGRWDGHSGEIDLKTKTLTRKIGSVLLLSQPSMIEFARKIRDKGGVVIANNSMMTRSIANEKHIIFVQEVDAGPHLHFAPTVAVLAHPPFDTEKDLYLDMLDKLQWGELFAFYLERLKLTVPSLAAKQYPMTFKKIRSGLVRGPQRIVTMNDGVYGWPNDHRLHAVYTFDARGTPVPNRFTTTVDQDGVRTQLQFDEHESSVIEPISAWLDTESPVNTRILRYEDSQLDIQLHGQGDATLHLFVGTRYPDKRDGVFTDGGINPGVIGVGDAFRVMIDDNVTSIEERDGTLSIPLKLHGPTRVVVGRAEAKPE